MSGAHDPLGHGHSVAAWTAVVIMIVGSVIGAFAFVVSSPAVFWVAVAVVVVGAVAGKVLQVMGLGAERSTRGAVDERA